MAKSMSWFSSPILNTVICEKLKINTQLDLTTHNPHMSDFTTYQFHFLDAQHEFDEDFLGLFARVFEGSLDGHNQLVS